MTTELDAQPRALRCESHEVHFMGREKFRPNFCFLSRHFRLERGPSMRLTSTLPFAIAALFAPAVVAADPGGPAAPPSAGFVSLAEDPRGVLADEVPATSAEVAKEGPGHGVAADVGLVSAYGFRGLNLLQQTGQKDQHLALQPSLGWTHEGSGLSVTWWGSFQLNGENRRALIDSGMGHEQDVTLARTFELAEPVKLGTSMTVYTYPFADEAAAGVAVPVYVEPAATLSYAGPVDLSLGVTWMYGVQEVLSAYRYAYVNPKVGRSFELSDRVSLSTAAGYGFKAAQESPDNVHDVQLDLGAAIALDDTFQVKPAVHGAWTNLEAATLGDEVFAWASVNVSAGF